MREWWRRKGWLEKGYCLAGAAVALAITLFLTGWINFFVSPYQTRETLDDGTRIVTNYDRFGRTPRWRMVVNPTFGITVSGPLSESGKRHGKWFAHGDGYFSDQWYWYDELVSEGRWRELNR
jgi:hypothetical protein